MKTGTKPSKIYRVLSQGGIGDALLTTPLFKALKNRYPDSRIKVLCIDKGHLEIYKNNPYINTLHILSQPKTLLGKILIFFRHVYINKKYSSNLYGVYYPVTIHQIHASRLIADMFDVKLDDVNIEIFLTDEEKLEAKKIMAQYANPIIVHAGSATSDNKHWSLEKWEKLVAFMPQNTFIQIGLTSEPGINGAVDFRGSSIRESIALIGHAKSFVGVDSSFAHATNAVGTPGVILFGPSTPMIWGHQNNINLFKDVSCSPCLDVLRSSKCPYNRECMHHITVEDVRNSLEKQAQ